MTIPIIPYRFSPIIFLFLILKEQQKEIRKWNWINEIVWRINSYGKTPYLFSYPIFITIDAT